MRACFVPLLMLPLCASLALGQVTESSGELTPPAWDEAAFGPLPRYRPNVPPVDPNQSLHPFAIETAGGIAAQPLGLVASPPEYSPTRGVLYRYSNSAWPTVVRDCVVQLTQPGFTEIAYVLVNNTTEQSSAISQFTAGGADLSRVQFIIKTTDSIWARDYGPHFIWQDDAAAIVDSHYYPGRPNDNYVPTNVSGDTFNIPAYGIDLYYSGGNFQPGPSRTGFLTNLINADNPGFTNAFIGELYQKYQGIDTMHIFPRLPSSVDATGHIDMWMYLIDEDSVIISQFIPGSNSTAISVTNNAVPYMQNLGFTVHRPPAFNANYPGFGIAHFTYANAYRVNNRIFIPAYGAGNSAYLDEDAAALATWQAAAPGVQIVPINCYPIIWAAGAIHCIVMQVPQYIDELPSGLVVSPAGGELLISGTQHTIRWNASDNETITGVELFYSLDDGGSWTSIATTSHTRSYNWTVPAANSTQARVKIAITDNDNNTVEFVSAQTFSIRGGSVNEYTFATGGGVDKFGWGNQTTSWASVNTTRLPVVTSIGAANYPRIATSNATGGETDANRYVATIPGSTSESTHVYEFILTENAADIGQIDLTWEGYAADCTNVELYVWDVSQTRWGNGAGLVGENLSMDSAAGTRDGVLVGSIRSNFANYLTPDNRLTVLVYTDRSGDRTVHDFISVKVSVPDTTVPADVNCDGSVDFFDIDAFLLALFDPTGYATAYPGCSILSADVSGDGSVDFFDIDPFVNCLFVGCP